MKRIAFLLIASLSAGAATAQTTPAATNSPGTTRSTNTVGLGSTVNGSPTSSEAATGAPARYDDRNSGLPSGQVRMKTGKTKQARQAAKMDKKTKM